MSLTQEAPTPKGENELKENTSYLCTESTSNIEILSLDEINNIISFKCPSHGTRSMKIEEYLNNMKKNTFLYNKCSKCQKQQNEINNSEIFNFCTNCNLIICNKCIFEHDKTHFLIKNNKRLTKCILHPKNNNSTYCFDCNCHLCKECLKHRKHIRHKKQSIEEIEPSYEEINVLLKLINKYKDKMNSYEIEKNNQLIEIENKYNENKAKANDEYNINILKNKKDLDNELIESENTFNDEINEIKKIYEKEMKDKKNRLENRNKSINDKYKRVNENDKNTYDKKLGGLEQSYKNEIKKIENEFKQKTIQLKELLNINDIIYTTYNEGKENYFHSLNIINLLINYYEKGNTIIKEMENNEDFMETIKQKEYEINNPKKGELIESDDDKKDENDKKEIYINKNEINNKICHKETNKSQNFENKDNNSYNAKPIENLNFDNFNIPNRNNTQNYNYYTPDKREDNSKFSEINFQMKNDSSNKSIKNKNMIIQALIYSNKNKNRNKNIDYDNNNFNSYSYDEDKIKK